MVPLQVPRERSIDIDDRLDFDMAHWLHQRSAGAHSPISA